MKKLTLFLILTIILTNYSCKKNSSTADEKQEQNTVEKRILSLHGGITEIVSALGFEENIVGVDVTSTYPESIKQNAMDLGHVSSLSIESIITLKPDMILAMEKEMKPDLLVQIRSAGIPITLFKQEYTIEGTKNLISEVAEVLQTQNHSALQEAIETDFSKVKSFASPPKVLFIYARGAGTLMVAGKNTPMEHIVTLANGEYIIDEFEDFKPLTPESLVQNNPDVILLFNSGFQSLGGANGLLNIPGVAQTNAGRNKAFVVMDGGLLTGFGPRVGKAAVELNKHLAERAE